MNAQPATLSETTFSLKTRIWDSVEHLRDEESIRLYMEAALEEAPDDLTFIAVTLGDIARARTLLELSRKTGIERNALYHMTRGEGESHPTVGEIARLAQALEIELPALFATRHAQMPHPELAHA